MPETNARIKVCHDTAANFKTNNPTLLVGEWALETDTKKMKIGDGTTAYNSLPYSTAEDSDEWQKPSDWIDISSAAITNSIYLLVGHALDFSKYKELCFSVDISTSSNTYDVYVDGIKQATTASGTDTTLNWQTLALDSGYDVTYPSALRTHIVRITPTQSTDTMSRFRSRPISGQQEQGLLWAHFELSNAITIINAFGTESSIRNYLLEAVTAKNDNITYNVASTASSSGFHSTFRSCTSLKKIPVLTAASTTYKSGDYISFSEVPLKKVVIKGNSGAEGLRFLNNTKVQEFDIENGVVLSSGLQGGDDAHGASNLKKLPPINASDAETFQANGLTSLQDTFIDDSSNSSRKVLRFYGTDASHPVLGLKGLVVSNAAPFDGASPQINVSYTGLSRTALVNLFKSMPYNVGYTVVGTPTIVDGVVSFQRYSYVKIPSSLTNTAIDKNVEIQFKLNTPSDMTGYQYLISQLISSGVFGGINLYINAGYLGSLASMDGSNWSGSTTNYKLSADTTYDLKYNYNKDTYQEKFSIKQGDTWTEVATIQRASAIYGRTDDFAFGSGVSFGNQLRGTLDLNSISVKFNGVTYFNGAATRQLSSDITAVGSPSISNGVVTGFSASKYLQAQQLPADFWTNDFEICVALKTPASWPAGDAYLLKGSRRRVGDTGSDTGILAWWSNNKLAMTGSYRNTSGTSPFGVEITPELNTMYFMKMVQEGHTISGYYSLDGASWTLLNTADDYGYAGTPNILATLFGQDDDCSGFSIDLNSTYIKSGSSIWLRPMAPMVKTCSVVGCTGTADLTADDKAIATGKGWSLTVA